MPGQLAIHDGQVVALASSRYLLLYPALGLALSITLAAFTFGVIL